MGEERGPTERRPTRAGAVAEVVAWWLAGTAVWLATLSSFDLPDVELALGAALLAAVLTRTARRAAHGAWRPPWRALTAVALLPAAVLVDTAGVALVLLAPGRRRGRVVGVPVAHGSTPAASGQRAALVWLADATPSSLVLDVDPAAGSARVHVLVSGRPDVLGRLSADPDLDPDVDPDVDPAPGQAAP